MIQNRHGEERTTWGLGIPDDSQVISLGFLSFQELHPTLKSGGPKQMVSVNEITLFRMCGHGHTPTLLHAYKRSFLPTLFCFPPNKFNEPVKFSEAMPLCGRGRNHLEGGGLPSECSLAPGLPRPWQQPLSEHPGMHICLFTIQLLSHEEEAVMALAVC